MIRHLAWELRARSGSLPKKMLLPRVLPAPEGRWRLGMMSGGGELIYDPWGIDPPHVLVAGTTESGKTRLLEYLALTALVEWPWRVNIIDFKGGGDFKAATDQGAEVVSEGGPAVAMLREIAAEISRRNSLLRETVVRRNGKLDRATTLRDLDLATRIELNVTPWLIVIDETADIVARKKEGGPDALQAIVQLGRSAGVHLMLGMQRPDSSLLDGFVKHNVQARILLGKSDPITDSMVIGSATSAVPEPERLLTRGKGRGIASGIGGRPGVRFQAYLLDRHHYLEDDLEGHLSASSTHVGSALGGASPASSGARPRFRDELPLLAARLSGASFHDPPPRDPWVVEQARERDEETCQVCGSPEPVQVDHLVPLWAGGPDSLQNAWVLCVPCHAVKTAAEAPHLARARAVHRGVSREPLRFNLPRLAWEWWCSGALFLLGLFWNGLSGYAALALLAVLFGPTLIREYLIPRPFRRSRGRTGINAYGEWEANQEKKRKGYIGRTAQRVYGFADVVTMTRTIIIQATASYLLAVAVAWRFL